MQERSGIKNIYKFYKQNVSTPAPYAQFKSIWDTFVEGVIKEVVLEGRDFNMPSLGSFGIRKQKVIVAMTPDGDIDKRYLRPDWKSTKELWARDAEAKKRKQLVFHLNKHFNGYNCKWFWDKATCSVPNNPAYSLSMTRANKRLLAQVINSEDYDVDYHEQKPKVRSREHSNQYE
jgi:hypothetical protein